MEQNHKKRIVISLGGSLLLDNTGINTSFLSALHTFIRRQVQNHANRQFFLVVGGGATARLYRDAGREVLGHELSVDDLDWLGIHSTRLNAHLVRTIFRDIAHPSIIKDYDIILKTEAKVVVAGGWKPGWSTDYCAALLAGDYTSPLVINMTNTPYIFDKDPKHFPDAQPIEKISWADFRSMVGDEWKPGLHAPFDPIASKKAQELGLKVIVLGSDFENLEKCLNGQPFVGSVIK